MYLNGAQRFSLVHSVSFFIVSDNMTGSHSLYTIYEGHEIMFHVSTMLPFTPDNPQQVTNMCSTLLCIKCKIVANFVRRLSFSTPMKGPGFKPWLGTLCCQGVFLSQIPSSHSASLHPGERIGSGKILVGQPNGMLQVNL